MVAGLAALFAGLAFPGFGAAVVGRLRIALALAVAVPLFYALCLVTPWAVWISFGARLASGVLGGWWIYRSRERHWLSTPTLATIGGHLVAMLLLLAFVIEGVALPSSSMAPTLSPGDHLFTDKLTPMFHAIERGDIILFNYPCDQRREYVKRVIAVGGDSVEVRCHIVYVNGKAIPATLVAAKTTYDDYLEDGDRWVPATVSEYSEELGGHRYRVFSDTDRAVRPDDNLRDFPMRGRRFSPSCSNAPDFDNQVSEARKLSGTGTIVEDKPEDTAPCELQSHYVVPPHTLFTLGDNRDNSNDSRVWGVVGEQAVIGRASGIWMSKTPGVSFGRVGRVD
jgi:signal peptidase I